MITFEHLWAGFLTLVVAFLSLFGRHIGDKVKTARDLAVDAKKAAAAAAKDIADHKLFAAENFARSADLKEHNTRMVERFDKVFEHLDEIKDRLPPRTHA